MQSTEQHAAARNYVNRLWIQKRSMVSLSFLQCFLGWRIIQPKNLENIKRYVLAVGIALNERHQYIE